MKHVSTFLCFLFIGTSILMAQAFQPVSESNAISTAINQLTQTDQSVHLQNALYFDAYFDENGFDFQPQHSSAQWRWQLLDIYSSSQAIWSGDKCATPTILHGEVHYQHEAITELYLAHKNAIEQQFVLQKNPTQNQEDLIIEGIVIAEGEFEAKGAGWVWKHKDGDVTLGNVYVYDAKGYQIPASMEVEENFTRISVDGTALASATYPVTIDPKVGTNEFRISTMGPDGNNSYDAFDPRVVYNSTDDEFMVVWSGDTIPGEDDIWGQRIDGTTGALIGPRIRVSNMASAGLTDYDAFDPAIDWNATDNEYLVVWSGDDNTGSLVNGENEIWGQRLSNTGSQLGTDDFRISFVGTDGDNGLDGFDPDVSWNSINNQYLVVWSADTLAGKDEIFGQILSNTGSSVGNNFQISFTGDPTATNFDAEYPRVAYNSNDNQFLIVWYGDNFGVAGEDEIYARRYDASNLNPLDTAIVISDLGIPGNNSYDAQFPEITWNENLNEYLVVWRGDDTTGLLMDNEITIFGQILNSLGQETGPNDFIISELGTVGDGDSDAFEPRVTYSSVCGVYAVVFHGDSAAGPYSNGEEEIFLRYVNTDGTLVGDDSTISTAGPLGDPAFDSDKADIAFNPSTSEFLIVWGMEDNVGLLIDGENEIYGQRFSCAFACQSVFGTDIVTACDSFTWIDGNTYTASNNSAQFTIVGGASTGCDSVVTLDLTLNVSSSGLVLITACDSFTWIDGNTYTSNNNTAEFNIVGGAANGCDSTLRLDLTINNSATSTDVVTACESFTWIDGNTYTADNNTATFNLAGQAANGCDSVVTLNLTVIDVDISVTNTSPTLTANATGATYQWIDCDNSSMPIVGATSQSFTPPVNGNYAVIVEQNDCIDTSACQSVMNVSLDPFAFDRGLEIYPNPSSGLISLRFTQMPTASLELKLMNLRGQEVMRSERDPNLLIKWNLKDLPEGIYFLQVKSGDSSSTRKIVIR